MNATICLIEAQSSTAKIFAMGLCISQFWHPAYQIYYSHLDAQCPMTIEQAQIALTVTFISAAKPKILALCTNASLAPAQSKT